MDTTRVGRELADARVRLGFSLEDLAARTTITIERLRAIEDVDLAQLPPLVYLRGSLREYAATVQLDPETTAERYLAELADPAGLCDTSAMAGPEPEPAMPSAWILDVGRQSFHGRETDLAMEFPSELAVRPRLLELRPAAPLSDGSAPLVPSRRRRRRRSRWLAPIVGVVALAVGSLAMPRPLRDLILSLASPDAGSSSGKVAPREGRNYASDARVAPSTPAVGTTEAETTSPARAGTDAEGPGRDASALVPVLQAPSTQTAPPAERGLAVPSRDIVAVTRNAETGADGLHGLSGRWSLTTRVERPGEVAAAPLNRGYRLQLRQDGDRITGSGHMWMENGRTLPLGQRTPIFVAGLFVGRRLDLQFTDRDGLADTFALTLEPDGSLSGRFESRATTASGRSVARRDGR